MISFQRTDDLIHDHPRCAILFGGKEHAMEFNEIHYIALETGCRTWQTT